VQKTFTFQKISDFNCGSVLTWNLFLDCCIPVASEILSVTIFKEK